MRKAAYPIFVLLFCAQFAGATDFYVAQSGGNDSNNCTQAQSVSTPKATLYGGISCLSSGDTLIVRSGTYTERLNYMDITIPNGSMGSPTRITAFSGETPTIFQPAGAHPQISLLEFTSGQQYITISGFILDADDRGATVIKVQLGATAIFVEDSELLNGHDNIALWGGASGGIIDSELHHGGQSGIGYGIYLSGDGNLFDGNDIHDNTGFGIHDYDNVPPGAGTNQNNIIRNNRIHDNGTNSCATGILIGGWTQLIYNNLIYNENGGGIQVGMTAPEDIEIYNNTIYNTGQSCGLFSGIYIGADANTIVVRNNLIISTPSDIIDLGTGSTLSHNLASGADFVNAAGGDFHLQSTSDAIDAGTTLADVTVDFDGNARPLGAAYDIGAYERIVTPPDIVNAVDCSDEEVQIAIDAVSPAGRVNIPAGTCSWDEVVTVTKDVRIFGNGTGSTIIRDNITDANGRGLTVTLDGAETFRLSQITFDSQKDRTGSVPSTGFIGVNGNGNSIIIDNLHFTDWTNINHDRVMVFSNVFGVIHSNIFDGGFVQFGEINHDSFAGVGAFGDNSWAQPTALGSIDSLYWEDNVFTNSSGIYQGTLDCAVLGGGCRVVARFNFFENIGLAHHGTESGGRLRGGRKYETYHNTFYGNELGMDSAQVWRSGTGVFWGNTLVGTFMGVPTQMFNFGVKMLINRATGSLGGWGHCDGTGQWDTNDGMVYASGTHTGANGATTLTDGTKSFTVNQWFVLGSVYSIRNTTQGWGSEINGNTATTVSFFDAQGPGIGESPHNFNTGDSYQILRASVCIDQPGRGLSDLISMNPAVPTGSVDNALEPVRTWTNVMENGTPSFGLIAEGTTNRLLANRDFYTQASGVQTTSSSPFDGTVGVGWGTRALRPITCTTGVAYWSEDQGGNWHTSNATANDGTLDVCTATNTWTNASYTPANYPHYLREEPVGGISTTGARRRFSLR